MLKKHNHSAQRWFWSYMRPYRIRMAAGLALVTATSFLAVVNPEITGYIVDEVIGDGTHMRMDLLPRCLLAMILVTALRSVLRLLFLYLFETSSQGLLYDLRDGVYRNLLLKDFAFYNRARTGDLMSRQTGDMMAIRHFIAYVIYSLYENTLLLVAALVMIFSVDWRIGLAMLCTLPLTAVLVKKQRQEVRPKFRAIRDRFSSLNAFVQENISGNRVVRAFAKEEYEIGRFDRENEAYREAQLDAAGVWTKYVPLFEFMAAALTVVLMLAGGFMCIAGIMSLGSMVMINGFLWMLNIPLRMFGWLINDCQNFASSVEKIYQTIEAEPDIVTPVSPRSGKKLRGEVEFRDVSYCAEGETILRHVSFRAERGEKIGIIGSTGSGKSTIVNLLCRFYDVTDGAVLVDGVDVRDMDLGTLRDGIGLSMQDVFLFSDTVEGNIAYGRSDCSFEAVQWAARTADADGFIQNMPQGYDTVIGERGVGLSGGQRQRIALARALLKKPVILVLDDTTSAVDMETETQIQNSLRGIRGETVFIIAQRISSLKDCDQILVVENGEITERGTHEELLGKNGYYRRVFEHQYADYGGSYGKK
ncbi:ABC transporter ATP-binding protein [Lachnoclostridium sp. Marseille-P6806]|uniref:ABC transporter ATP-binding protein n=1 Tax=Lachnoclostridium sp. Marseille-P6806 TaxID=2364793 RepID=UPI0010302628|nr:ABC transporter ATP-binding protein [Lachnoclostridium sp. Marseille-P6806]